MSQTPVEITVAVPVLNRREQMERCLLALLRQDHPSYEVIVLDGGSTDGTIEACRRLAADPAPPVRVEVRAQDELPARRRNHGAAISAGEYLAFTDSDCLPTPGWLT